ncbi:MAG: enoyl-ACP reductase [Armatimonadota bacterium]
MGLLDGRKGLIYGVRNERSMAWGCAKSCAREGARLILTYLGEREEKDVRALAAKLGDSVALVAPCDLTDEAQVEALHAAIADAVGTLDFMVHGVAFAKKEELSGHFSETSLDGFRLALDVSAYTMVTASRAAAALMPEGGSMVTMTYLGSERVVPNYNIMGVAKAALEASVRYLANDLGPRGIRVNAVSPGMTLTSSALGISGFRDMYRRIPETAPLRKATDPDEVGDTCAFLVSNWSRGITGEIIHIDSGCHILGLDLGS